MQVCDPVVATLGVEDDAQPMMMAMAAAVNSGPSASPAPGLPETVNGTVTGSVNAADPEGDPLTYAVQSKSAGATVSVNGSGMFSYTPSHAQRLAAATTSGLDTDTFTVRVSDGQAFTDVPLTVVVRPGQLAAGAPVDVGRDPSGVAFNRDGSRAYVTNQYDKTVSVVNTANGAVLATITVPYAPKAVVVIRLPVRTRRTWRCRRCGGIETFNNQVVDLKPIDVDGGCDRGGIQPVGDRDQSRPVRGCMSAMVAAARCRSSIPPPILS